MTGYVAVALYSAVMFLYLIVDAPQKAMPVAIVALAWAVLCRGRDD